LTSTITELRCSVKSFDRGEAGDNVGLLLRGVEESKEEWLSLSQDLLNHTQLSKLRFIS
jgi:translation elongation factor EF-Tu-like GTPase